MGSATKINIVECKKLLILDGVETKLIQEEHECNNQISILPFRTKRL